ncbi:TPA: hypothetical protein HA242_07005 [Candidatus Woesearchaeota archaeon]|nr:hypothetical protein [Candidatus Woesearchaeota archaeon]
MYKVWHYRINYFMATQGITFELTEKEKEFAIKYVEESGFYKNRLADYLGVSRPTVYKLLEEDTNFFTQLKRADAIFCKSLIVAIKKKDPVFILKTKFKEEF